MARSRRRTRPIGPRCAVILRTTSSAPLYTPLSAVCSRTLTRSKGCPDSTAQTPPTPPATNALMDCTSSELAAFATSLTSCAALCTSSFSSFVVLGIFWRRSFGFEGEEEDISRTVTQPEDEESLPRTFCGQKKTQLRREVRSEGGFAAG